MKHKFLINLELFLRYSLVVLFIYTTYMKIIDFGGFRFKLYNSSILNKDSIDFLSYLVPVSEISIAILLLIKKTRFLGLLLSSIILILFTIYLYILNDYSVYDGCSCGGIFETISYKLHFALNIVFIITSFILIYLDSIVRKKIFL